MVKKQLLNPDRVRKIEGSFGYIEHRFLRWGFWAGLGHHELLLYFFQVLSLPEKPVAPDNQAKPMHPAVQNFYNRLTAQPRAGHE